MKRKVSMSFCLLTFLTILSLPSMLNAVLSIGRIFSGFNVLVIVSNICSIISTLMPLVFVALLYANTKRDVKRLAATGLAVFGTARLLTFVLNLRQMLSSFSGGDMMLTAITLVGIINTLAVTTILFLASVSIRQEKKIPALAILAAITFYLNLIPLGVSVLIGTVNSTTAITPFLLIAGLALLPKTIYDYDNCVFANQKSLLIVVAIVVLFAVAMFIAGGELSNSDSGGNGYNDGGSYRCNNCGGDGWDSENNCSCVWCGGDGKTSWNQ